MPWLSCFAGRRLTAIHAAPTGSGSPDLATLIQIMQQTFEAAMTIQIAEDSLFAQTATGYRYVALHDRQVGPMLCGDESLICSRKVLVCYLPLGDPLMPPDMAHIYVSCGVDVLEVGFPDANPVLDGSLVRSSMKRSLMSGMTPPRWRAQLSEIRDQFPETYIVAMGYADLSSLVVKGDGELLANAVLHVGTACQTKSDVLRKVAFVSTRLEEHEIVAARSATSYVMVQANEGKTGLRRHLPATNQARIERLRKEGICSPLLLGIGISTVAQTAKALAFGADGVVIGSACISAALKGRYALSRFVRDVRDVLDA